MSEYTDSIIDGDFDFHTGEYLGNGGGFPRSCFFKKSSKNNDVGGVVNFLNSKLIASDEQMSVIRCFFDYDTTELTKKDLCKIIQSDFKKFRKYVKQFLNKNNYETK